MFRREGMTLLEVLVALVIISVGILAAAALQSSSFGASRQARISAQITELAEGELAVQRQLEHTSITATTPNCATAMPSSTYSCRISLRPCQLSSAQVNCASASVSSTNLVGHYATVTVTGPRNSALSLATLIRKYD